MENGMKRIVVVGAGFAGLWSAVGAARKLDELRVPTDQVEVVVINGTPYHSIRVRNYEQPLDDTLVPLSDVLDRLACAGFRASCARSICRRARSRLTSTGKSNGSTTTA